MIVMYVLLLIDHSGLSAFTAAFGTSANSATASKMESCRSESCPSVNFLGSVSVSSLMAVELRKVSTLETSRTSYLNQKIQARFPVMVAVL